MATEHGSDTNSVSQSKISVSVPLRSLRASHGLVRDRKMISAVRASDSPPEPWRSFLAKCGESHLCKLGRIENYVLIMLKSQL
jgi:hypothetical protein